MSYSRGKYYIWGGKDGVNFCIGSDIHQVIPYDAMDVYIASLSTRKGELRKSIKRGKKMMKEENKKWDEALKGKYDKYAKPE